jgi:hypothetical protein
LSELHEHERACHEQWSVRNKKREKYGTRINEDANALTRGVAKSRSTKSSQTDKHVSFTYDAIIQLSPPLTR